MPAHEKITRRNCLTAAAAAVLAAKGHGAGDVVAQAPPASDAAPSTTSADQTPINVGSSAQLLCDERFTRDATNISIDLNPPKKLGPVLKPDQPWEDFRLTSYFTVIQDGKLARMYYSCFAVDQWNVADAWQNHSFLCYAESTDGIHWEKPALDIVEYNGSKKNNILMRCVVDGTVFIDPAAPPERRYKLLHSFGAHTMGLYISYSSDGVRFTSPKEPVSTWRPDSQQNAFYDTRLRKYVAYLRNRPYMGIDLDKRSVVRLELDDIEKPWPTGKPQLVFTPDAQDPAELDFYTNAVAMYPGGDAPSYFMFPASYHHYPPQYGNDGLLDSAAAFSRDGIRWERPDRRPYVALGLPGEWDSAFIMVGVGMLRFGDRIYQYYNGTDLSHGGTRKESKNADKVKRQWGWMGGLQQDRDRFFAATAPYGGGSFVTPPLVFDGSQLRLNMDASAAGRLAVSLLDARGSAIPGFGEEDCDPVMGNDFAHAVTWKGKSDLSSLRGRPIQMRFNIRSAKLYAFQFVS